MARLLHACPKTFEGRRKGHLSGKTAEADVCEKSVARATMPGVRGSDGPERAFMGPSVTIVSEEPDEILQQKGFRNRYWKFRQNENLNSTPTGQMVSRQPTAGPSRLSRETVRRLSGIYGNSWSLALLGRFLRATTYAHFAPSPIAAGVRHLVKAHSWRTT